MVYTDARTGRPETLDHKIENSPHIGTAAGELGFLLPAGLGASNGPSVRILPIFSGIAESHCSMAEAEGTPQVVQPADKNRSPTRYPERGADLQIHHSGRNGGF